ncbi:MAG: hypothetical protein Q4A17_12395 [Thermoguttaceae bacterium]|nr:hypothetical protein [Thermoguttaceae bacterium]
MKNELLAGFHGWETLGVAGRSWEKLPETPRKFSETSQRIPSNLPAMYPGA